MSRLLLLAAIAAAVSCPSIAFSQAITIQNHSFEDLSLQDGHWADNNIPGWDISGSLAGTQNWTDTQYAGATDSDGTPSTVPHGLNSAFLRVPGTTISQSLNATLRANSTYDLGYHVGRRADGLFPKYRAELYAGSQLIAVDDNRVTPSSGTWTKVNTSVKISEDHSSVGEQLSIRFSSYGATDPSNQPGVYQVGIDNVSVHEIPTTKVNLAFGENVPWAYKTLPNAFGIVDQIYTSPSNGELNADASFDINKVLSETQQIFDRAGVRGIEFVNEVGGNAKHNVFFTGDSPLTGLLGQQRGRNAVLFLDEVKANSFFANDLETNIAEVVAHEVGHIFGARHANIFDDGRDVMDSSFASNDELEANFNVSPAGTTDPIFLGLTHNPQYMLKRTIDKYSHAQLEAEGINAGTYDRVASALIEIGEIQLNVPDFDLFDFRLFQTEDGFGGSTLTELLRLEQVSASEIATLLEAAIADPTLGDSFTVVGKTAEDGIFDALLSTGNPFENTDFSLIGGAQQLNLQIRDDSSRGYFTAASGTINVSSVPEPNVAAVLLALTTLAFNCRRRSLSFD